MEDNDLPARTSRDSGTFVGGYVVGGGRRGKRADQDDAVVRFAERLTEMFPEHEVTIRYNTDRLGGGAWLVDGVRDAMVGLGADLIPPEWHREQFKRYTFDEDDDVEKPPSPTRMDPDDLVLKYSVKLAVPAVDDDHPELRDPPSTLPDRARSLHRRFDTFDAAWQFFEETVDADAVPTPD